MKRIRLFLLSELPQGCRCELVKVNDPVLSAELGLPKGSELVCRFRGALFLYITCGDRCIILRRKTASHIVCAEK